MPHHLSTERLHLRPVTLRDAKPFHAIANRPRMAMMTGTWAAPFTEDYVRERFSEYLPDGERPNEEYAISYKGEMAGTVGLYDQTGGTFELTYWIGEGYEGLGIATEASRALCLHAFKALRAKEIVAYALIDNPASIKVMIKLGFLIKSFGTGWCEHRQANVPAVAMRLVREDLRL